MLGSLYAGVDSLASELVDGARRLPSAVQYPYAAVRALLTYRPGEVVVTVDGVEHRHRAYTVVVANSAYYGKGMRIAPEADVRDGLLDVVVLPAGSRWGMVRRLPRVYDGSHVDLPEVVVLRGTEVRVEAGPGRDRWPTATASCSDRCRAPRGSTRGRSGSWPERVRRARPGQDRTQRGPWTDYTCH